jgi:hypothetical protein
MPNLDDIAISLSQKLRDSTTTSFVSETKTANKELQLKFDVVKAVIATRLAEKEEAQKARLNSEKKQKILALIDQKENEKLAGQSLEDLKALANSL